VLVQAMQHPAAGEPHRPTGLQVRAEERCESLRPHLEEIGVELAVAEELDQIKEVFNQMCAPVCGKPPPGLLDMPGVTPDQVGGFYQAAASFFRQAPWILHHRHGPTSNRAPSNRAWAEVGRKGPIGGAPGGPCGGIPGAVQPGVG